MVKTTVWLLTYILFLPFNCMAQWTYLSNNGNLLDISMPTNGLKFQHRNSDVIFMSSYDSNKKHYFLRIFTQPLMVEIENKSQLQKSQWHGQSGEAYHSTKLRPIVLKKLKLNHLYLIEVTWPKGERYSLLFDLKVGLVSFTNLGSGVSYFMLDTMAYPYR